MLPQHHLLQLVPNRIEATLSRLQYLIWEGMTALETEVTAAGPRQLSFAEAHRLPRRKAIPQTSWGKLFDQRWCRILLPKTRGDVWLNWRDQGEATLYLDGEPYFGFDVAHRHCRLPRGTREVWIEANCLESAIWHPKALGLKEGSLFEGAFLCRRNEEAWKAWHDLKCLFEVAMDRRHRENPQVPTILSPFGLQPVVDKFSPVYRRMLRLMDEAVDAFEKEGLTAFAEKMAGAYQYLKKDDGFIRCILTGHAHIDLVWLWPERIGELKAVHTFSTVTHLMEEYPEFRFAYSQPASYEAVKRRNPALYQKVQGRIGSGQWQATGAMYVESDTMMACGEALGRSFLLGQKGFREINGKASRLTWLPDVFGYSACLPQIMKQHGVDYFFTTKMTWNAINRFPHSSFTWKGNDGSRILAHVIQDCGYNTHVSVTDIQASMNAYQQADIHSEFLLPTGYGDGGGGPTAEMCERARRLSSLPGMPEMVWDQPEAFFDRLAKMKERLPVHQGECYLEYHRGTFTTHGNLKEIFRALERSLHLAEAVSSVSDRHWEKETAWKRLVFAQFHDYIPGSSTWDVYLEGLPELLAQAKEQKEKTLAALSKGPKGKACLFNPHALAVKRWVRDAKTKETVYVSLPPLTGSSVAQSLVEMLPDPVVIQGKTVSNGLAEFHLDASGWIDRLILDGTEVALDGALGQLVLYPDRAANFESWDIDRQVLSLGKVCDSRAVIKSFKEGDHRAGFRVRRKIGLKSSATVSYSLEAGSALLDIAVELDWKEPEHLLKLIFPTRYAAVQARFGAPFGTVLRPQISNGMQAEAMWEVPFSRHLAVFDEGEREGLFLVTESKYGAYVKDGEIGLSLLRSPRVSGFEMHNPAWPPALSRLKVPSPYSDIGTHRIRLALGRHDVNLPRERQAAAVAETHFSDPCPYEGAVLPSPLQTIEGGETVIPVWAKPVGPGEWILRLHEVAGRRGEFQIKANPGWRMAQSDLSEKLGPALPKNGTVAFTPYQIISLRFRRTTK